MIGKYQVMSGQAYNGPTLNPQATLSALANLDQPRLTKAMIRVSAVDTGKTLEAMLAEIPVKQLKSLNDEWYDIVDMSRRNIQLEKATDLKGNIITAEKNKVGAFGEKFYLYFPEDYFFEGETLEGEKNELYPIRILDKKPAGTGVRHLVEMQGAINGMPGSELQLGKKFSRGAAYVERGLSREVGGINSPSTARVKTFLSTVRIDHKVAGDIDDYGMIFSLPAQDHEGKEIEFKVMSTKEDWQVERRFSEYKTHALVYGVSNIDEAGATYNKGVSGRDIKIAPGLRQQQEQSNKIYFNYFSLDLLENASQQLGNGTQKIQELNFIVRTGRGGAQVFNKAVADKATGWAPLSDGNPNVINKVNSSIHTFALGFGAQFVQYRAPNGAIFTLEIDSSYDDLARNKIMMPGTNLTAESFRMDIVYMGTKENPNVQRLGYSKHGSGGEFRGYSSGFRNPLLGTTSNNNMSYSEDSATITKFTHLGIAMYDPDKCLALIPLILA